MVYNIIIHEVMLEIRILLVKKKLTKDLGLIGLITYNYSTIIFQWIKKESTVEGLKEISNASWKNG